MKTNTFLRYSFENSLINSLIHVYLFIFGFVYYLKHHQYSSSPPISKKQSGDFHFIFTKK